MRKFPQYPYLNKMFVVTVKQQICFYIFCKPNIFKPILLLSVFELNLRNQPIMFFFLPRFLVVEGTKTTKSLFSSIIDPKARMVYRQIVYVKPNTTNTSIIVYYLQVIILVLIVIGQTHP